MAEASENRANRLHEKGLISKMVGLWQINSVDRVDRWGNDPVEVDRFLSRTCGKSIGSATYIHKDLCHDRAIDLGFATPIQFRESVIF